MLVHLTGVTTGEHCFTVVFTREASPSLPDKTVKIELNADNVIEAIIAANCYILGTGDRRKVEGITAYRGFDVC